MSAVDLPLAAHWNFSGKFQKKKKKTIDSWTLHFNILS